MFEFLLDILKFVSKGIYVLIFLLLGYLYFDPFYILKNYEDYSDKITSGNKDYISTTTLLKNWERINYNSFIFGSSRTVAFNHSEWKKYLPDSASIFTYDAYSETIFGIYRKIKFLDSLGIPLKNAIVLIEKDETFMTETNSKGYLFIKHPSLTKESLYLFHWEFLKAYLTPRFLFNYYFYKFSNKYYPFMLGIIEPYKVKINPITNETTWVELNQMLEKSEDNYYKKMSHLFPQRTGKVIVENNVRITNNQIRMLKEIKEIFEKHKTNYRLIISPLYNQIYFNKTDLFKLRNIFGNNLFDYSGINEITNRKTNYYEFSHYRPIVGERILSEIY